MEKKEYARQPSALKPFDPEPLYKAPKRKPIVNMGKLYLENTGKAFGDNGSATFNLRLPEFARSERVKVYVNEIYADCTADIQEGNQELLVSFNWNQTNAWNTLNGGKSNSVVALLPGNLFDSTHEIAEVSTVTTVADSGGSLNNKYFIFYESVNTAYYVWMNINAAGTDPAPTAPTGVTYTGIEVAGGTNILAPALAIAIDNAITASAAQVTSGVATNVVTITNDLYGNVPDTANVDAGFTIAVTTKGYNNVAYYNYKGRDDNYFVCQYDDSLKVTWKKTDGTSITPVSWNMLVTIERLQ